MRVHYDNDIWYAAALREKIKSMATLLDITTAEVSVYVSGTLVDADGEIAFLTAGHKVTKIGPKHMTVIVDGELCRFPLDQELGYDITLDGSNDLVTVEA